MRCETVIQCLYIKKVSSMNDKQASARNWLVPLAIGVLLPSVGWIGWRVVNPPIDPQNQSIAERRHWNPRTFNDTQNFQRVLEHGHELSDGEWKRLTEILSSDPEPQMRINALSVITQMQYSKRRNEAINAARPFLANKNIWLQDAAMVALWRLNAPDWRQEMTQRLNSPNTVIRDEAVDLLRRVPPK